MHGAFGCTILMQVTGYKKKTYKADDHFDFLKVRRFDDWNTLEQYHCPSLPEIWLDSSPQYRLIGRQDLTDKEHATWTSFDRKRGRALPGGRGQDWTRISPIGIETL